MNVWSKGLGNVSLDLDLEKAALSTTIADDPKDNRFVFSGIIESNWWEYSASLTAEDMLGFIRVLGNPLVTRLVVKTGGRCLWLRFVAKLFVVGFRFAYQSLARKRTPQKTIA